ncbi:acyl-CoA reductase [Nonomuraea salmonea]|uniref:acyl-CoA reductase n=1 Tax=Nonomuraea salmonea TaxID=46181 RepID=UPI002FEC60CD
MLFPAGAAVPVEELLKQVGESRLQVGDERVKEFLAAFGRRLLRPALARRHPELGSLGFFLRPAELARTLAELAGEHVRVPRGLIFHLPPANVDTVFVYSWALSALMGNRNVVRLSPRSGAVAQVILETLHETLATADPVIAATQRIVSYHRSDEVTAALSAACDLRVVWGGDHSVREIRRHPLAPHARDLTFPDRSSFAVVRAAAWLCAPRAARVSIAEGFVNDTYWFDQAACSSPRTVFWVGAEDDCEAARADFTGHVSRVVTVRGWGSMRRWRWRSGCPPMGWRPTGWRRAWSSTATRWPAYAWRPRRRLPGAGWARGRSRTPGWSRWRSWWPWSSGATRR